MLFLCAVMERFWNSITEWFSSYIISAECIILCDLQNNPFFCFVILSAKKIIHNNKDGENATQTTSGQ